ncbi:zinc finger protein 667-like isoform X2 [Danaus plexippus]|uniref:zinc finger protein 667-like isoform X2 n=1 Tax=Danaus plexippus TaxID=13037 RepID=UPI002AB01DD3|nr:zinc finger protein 667-like isoform X2 [Danaus plexippus]
MAAIKLEKNNIICHGCLSVDRSLLPIKKNMDLYFILLGNQQFYSGKVGMFRQRLQRAQDMFSKMLLNWTPGKTLSQLSISKNIDYDLTCTENDNDSKIKIELNDSGNDYNETIVKEELDDTLNYNGIGNIDIGLKKIRSVRRKCKISDTRFTDDEKESLVVPFLIKLNDVFALPKKRNGVHYKNMLATCSKYIGNLAEVRRNDLERVGPNLECTDCGAQITDRDMMAHWDEHRVHLHRCNLCDVISRSRKEIIQHITEVHTKVYTCKECGIKCWKLQEFNKHYRNFHKYFVCDHCDKKFYSKSVIERHIRCRHLRPPPPEPPEQAYCVECDRVFPSQQMYRRHLRTAAAHRPPKNTKVPCPDCGKTFSRKVYMNNHHKQVHRRDSPHYCRDCDKYFINGYAIRTHVKFVHEKSEKPKNKICDICQRGFHTNRVLSNHRRTHTGERPYCCEHCGAAFAQLQARKTHERTQHRAAQ